MSRAYQVQNAFNGGEFSFNARARFDNSRYSNGLTRAENVVFDVQGPLFRRSGGRLVAPGKFPDEVVREIPFIFSQTDAFNLVFGREYVWFFTPLGQVFINDVPLEVTTPYTLDDLAGIDYAQSGNQLALSHPRHPPAELVRNPATGLWRYRPINFEPPPTEEFGLTPIGTLSDASVMVGMEVFNQFESSVPTFLETDVNRLINELGGTGNGSAVITQVLSATVVRVDIIRPFVTLPLQPQEWQIAGSPQADLSPDRARPLGGLITLSALGEPAFAPELVTNGDFSDGLNNWTNYSPRLFAEGTDDSGSNNKAFLVDTTKDFVSLGVLLSHRLINVTDGSEGAVAQISTTTNPDDTLTPDVLSGGTDDDFDDGDAYRVEDTSTVVALSGGAVLTGGVAGVAWLEQPIATTATRTYRVVFDVLDAPLSAQVGTLPQESNLFSEATFDIGNEKEFTFVADAAQVHIQFRNNQNVAARLDNVSVKVFSAETFRDDDVGKHIHLNGGIVQITEVTDTFQVKGIIRKILNSEDDVIGGAWSLEENVWTEARGFPAKVTYFQQRLNFAGTLLFPLDLWGSVTGLFTVFARGIADGDSYRFTLTAEEVNQIQWMTAINEILIGTAGEEFAISGGGGRAITPTNVIVRTPTPYGSSPIKPLRIGNAVCFTQRDGQLLRELIFQEGVDDLEARDLTILAADIAGPGFIEVAFQQYPQPTIWAVRSDGVLVSAVYLREQEVIGWARHPMQGNVKSVTVIPTGREDQVWIAVERFGTTFIEYLDTTGGFYGPLTVDSAISYNGEPTTTLSGLDHLAGQTVAVLGDGANMGTYVVSEAGTIEGLPLPVTRADVGLTFLSLLETLRAIEFTQSGAASPTIGQPVRNSRVVVGFISSLEGALIQGDPTAFREEQNLMSEVHPLFTGDYNYGGGTNLNPEGTVIISQELPVPMGIRYIIRYSEVGEL